MSILYLPNDIFYHIFLYLDYFSYENMIITLKIKLNFLYYKKKCNLINNFFYKKFFAKFSDLKFMSRKGHLVNLDSVLNNPQKYVFKKIQFISWFQYNFSYFEPGNIIEGYIKCINDAWVITDISTKRIHPLIDPFIFPKSIRVIY